jgi:hypothetical protein
MQKWAVQQQLYCKMIKGILGANTASHCQYKWPNSALSWHVPGQTPFGRMTYRRRQMLGGVPETLYCLIRTRSSFILRCPRHCLRPTANSRFWKMSLRETMGLRIATNSLRSVKKRNQQTYECYISLRRITVWGFQLSQLMRETSEFGNSKGVYSHRELPDFTALPESHWLQSPAAQLATNKHKAYWRRFPLFVTVARQMPGSRWKSQEGGQSFPNTKAAS